MLQRQSGTPHLPEWFISIFDIEIDENSNLGSGSFGVVKTALWGQTPVAVKRASANLSREVGLIPYHIPLSSSTPT